VFAPGRSKTGGERISNRQLAISHVNSLHFNSEGKVDHSLDLPEGCGEWRSQKAVSIIG